MRTDTATEREEILTLSEVAQQLRISLETARTRAKDKSFPNAFQTGKRGDWRVPAGDLEHFKSKYSTQQSPASGQEVSPAGDPEPDSQDGGAAAHTPPGSLPEAQRA